MKFADKVIEFNSRLTFRGSLPEGITIMNPFEESDDAFEISSLFYKKFYNDNNPRRIILGINPGRHGAGVTGIPFTDTKRLEQYCQLKFNSIETYETSSVFIYKMIEAYGGAESFYSKFYINSVSPLGFVKSSKKDRYINYNYYDSPDLTSIMFDFIIESIRKQIDIGVEKNIAYCLGTGKNFRFLANLNNNYKFFDEIIPLEHPRYIMQYKSSERNRYIEKYLHAFNIL